VVNGRIQLYKYYPITKEATNIITAVKLNLLCYMYPFVMEKLSCNVLGHPLSLFSAFAS
jgi:hypothetical protein